VIEFRPLEESDLPVLGAWLAREHVRLWWRKPIEQELAESRDGRFLVAVDGREVGMIQTYLVADHPEWGAIVGMEPGLAGVDILIGEADQIGRGLGPRVLEQFARDVVFARPETNTVVATVEEANRRSWRAFEKAGFRHVRDVIEDGLPNRLMRLDRS
jgi:aminoglycoside 6'-N-acetyltransferase